MRQYYEKVNNRILDVLNDEPIRRCTKLAFLFENCNMRELQDMYPGLINSIFGIGTGNIGWGLRIVTDRENLQCFQTFCDFFTPTGPMFQLCYRLLNDSSTFDIPINNIPLRLREMLQSGQYSTFYADLINIDSYCRRISSLSLNAFDYYILHFVLHATFPIHKTNIDALKIHNEVMKSAYMHLTIEYLHMFLPQSPDAVVMPTNICPNVKAPQSVSVQPILAPRRSPKYLKIPNTNLYNTDSNANVTPPLSPTENATPREYAWRTESVLYYCTDIWLRYDADETMNLPSTEFIRVVRAFIKQSHAFANSVQFDHTSMKGLRKLTQPMIRNLFYPFIKSIIGRWPLDSSLGIVLELWLSYIQPWRYTLEWQNPKMQSGNDPNKDDLPITNRFDTFIVDNVVIYTQIFILILKRFARLDFSSLPNVLMLHRLVKIFNQNGLPAKLYEAELISGTNLTIDLTRSPTRANKSFNDRSCSHQDDTYTPLFGPLFCNDIQQFIYFIYVTRIQVIEEINALKKANTHNGICLSLWKSFASWLTDYTPDDTKLQNIHNIPDILDFAIISLSEIFNVPIPSISAEELKSSIYNTNKITFNLCNDSDPLDISHVTPRQMTYNLANIKISIDPTTTPIQTYECKFLVRILHHISVHINKTCGPQIQNCWERDDFIGKVARQVLYGPMTNQWFDKLCGINTLCEEKLPPRVCLRFLASYQSLLVLFVALLFGYLIWGSPVSGLIACCSICLIYIFFMALLS